MPAYRYFAGKSGIGTPKYGAEQNVPAQAAVKGETPHKKQEGEMARMPISVDGTRTEVPPTRSRSPLRFIVLVFVLSLPFWVVGALTGLQFLPGVPFAALMFICPAAAAIILIYRENRAAGVIALLKRSFDCQRIGSKIWYVPILLVMPGVSMLSYGVMRWMGIPVPSPHFALWETLSLMLACFVAALGEELGWSGYAIEPMQERWGALRAGLLLGLVWATWHLIPLVQAHRAPNWIGWWCLGTVTMRVLLTWIYNNTGKSIFAVVLFHASANVCWQLFPIHGSFFDPRMNALILTLTAIVVTAVWGTRTLARFRVPWQARA